MGVSSSESHDLTAFYEMLSASFGVLSQNTGFYPSLDRIIETTLGPLNLGPRGGSYNEPISHLHRPSIHPSICFPARTSALVTIFHLPPVGVHDSCPPPSSSIDFCRFSCTHVLIWSPLTHFHQSTRQPPGHLSGTHSIGPQGSYVHRWNGHAGFCPPAH